MFRKFFEKTHLGIVWVVWFGVCLLIWVGMVELFTPDIKYFWSFIKIGCFISIIMGTFATLIFASTRHSNKVWVNLQAFNAKINETNDPVEFDKLYDELGDLWSECSGPSHYDEIRKLRALMDMKRQYLK